MRKAKRLPFSTEAEWLAARRNYVTATDSRVLLGFGYSGEDPFSLYVKKTSEIPVTSVSREQAWSFFTGRRMETLGIDVIRRWSQEELGRELDVKREGVKKFILRVSRDWPWMAATLDAYYHEADRLIPVEIKCVSDFVARDWREQAPLHVQIQVQHQMAVCGSPHGYAVACGGPGVHIVRRIERDESFINALIPVLQAFWKRVEDKEPPAIGYNDATAAALKNLFPEDQGTAIKLPTGLSDLVYVRKRVKDRISELQSAEKGITNYLKASMGEASFCECDEGSFSWKTNKRKAVHCPACKHEITSETKVRTFRSVNKVPDGIEYVDPNGVEIDLDHLTKLLEAKEIGVSE